MEENCHDLQLHKEEFSEIVCALLIGPKGGVQLVTLKEQWLFVFSFTCSHFPHKKWKRGVGRGTETLVETSVRLA